MPEYAKPMARLIEELKRLPGIGTKSAQRVAFHLLKADDGDAERLADAIRDLKQSLRLCELCNNVTDVSPCSYCSDSMRSSRQVCVVEEPTNIVPIEKSGQFQGQYHVLHGALSPLQGIGPDQLRIANLLERIQSSAVEEVILATNATVEGEATAVYLSKLLKPLGVTVTRIAMGIPVGGDLEYLDSVTIGRSLQGRKEM
ncbi:MAG: recombination protein RecR [Acidobacteria bacterium RIFCSPLOWO2_02_FULL_59_13]|nr:MAG: recombination protein RecR [Acidobacteria bacterium RIFCSPLOWO2_02_FULL_59_13]